MSTPSSGITFYSFNLILQTDSRLFNFVFMGIGYEQSSTLYVGNTP